MLPFVSAMLPFMSAMLPFLSAMLPLMSPYNIILYISANTASLANVRSMLVHRLQQQASIGSSPRFSGTCAPMRHQNYFQTRTCIQLSLWFFQFFIFVSYIRITFKYQWLGIIKTHENSQSSLFMFLNLYSSDVDCSKHSVFLFAHVLPLVTSYIFNLETLIYIKIGI